MIENGTKANETVTTRHQRLTHVSQMRANSAIEGIVPRSDDLTIQQRYVDGTLSLAGMLQHAHDHVRAYRNDTNH